MGEYQQRRPDGCGPSSLLWYCMIFGQGASRAKVGPICLLARESGGGGIELLLSDLGGAGAF
jgi:hypothetical protein